MGGVDPLPIGSSDAWQLFDVLFAHTSDGLVEVRAIKDGECRVQDFVSATDPNAAYRRWRGVAERPTSTSASRLAREKRGRRPPSRRSMLSGSTATPDCLGAPLPAHRVLTVTPSPSASVPVRTRFPHLREGRRLRPAAVPRGACDAVTVRAQGSALRGCHVGLPTEQ